MIDAKVVFLSISQVPQSALIPMKTNLHFIRPKSVVGVSILAVFLFSACVLSAQPFPLPGLVIGSANTAFADPPVPRPNTVPCVVQLFNNIAFNNFSPKFFTFQPPVGCPGPWAKVVLTADFSVQAGRQFDRTAEIWIGGVNVYFGTTSEPSRTVARSWHVERDLTDYTALFNTTQNGRVDLGNLVNSTFTSTLFGTAQLQFYPLAHNNNGNGAPKTADLVLPLASDPTGGTAFLNTTANSLSKTFTLPTNVERAFLDVVAQSQANDEFWYTCVPNDVANQLQSCGGTGFRESEVNIDGQPAGVAPVYPWIYTGGIDPFLWRPIPGVQTLNFVPYRVDLTPFVGVLSNSQPHTVSVNVFNANFGFSTTATLLLFQDHGAQVVTGQVTQNTIGAGPTPNVVENLNNASGNITGTVTVTSSRQFTVAGFVNTSHGTVRTNVDQSISFSNIQSFNITNTEFVQNITQRTNISSETKTQGGGDNPRAFQQNFQWPLDLDFSFNINPDGSGAQTTIIKQQYLSTQSGHEGPGADSFRSISNTVTPSDTLLFDANGNLTGTTGQQSAQTYFSHDSTGGCFSRTITAATGLLTSVADGNGCQQ
jgi:hypothetical protein